MQVDHSQDQCHREGCACSVPNGEEYCSDHCRAAAQGNHKREDVDKTCACGHETCGVQ